MQSIYQMTHLLVTQVIPSAPLARETDYSDPFDARSDLRTEPDLGPATPCENNGYMEPYEAQRVLTGRFLPRPSHNITVVRRHATPWCF